MQRIYIILVDDSSFPRLPSYAVSILISPNNLVTIKFLSISFGLLLILNSENSPVFSKFLCEI